VCAAGACKAVLQGKPGRGEVKRKQETDETLGPSRAQTKSVEKMRGAKH
jgi:hypothetical protein